MHPHNFCYVEVCIRLVVCGYEWSVLTRNKSVTHTFGLFF